MSGELLAAWERTLRRRGGDRAVIEAATGRSATFRELDAGAQAWLEARRLAPGALAGRAVVFAVPGGIGWLEIFVALLRAGAVAVPLDGGEPAAAQRHAAEALRAGWWWDAAHARLEPLANARRFRDEAVSAIKLTSGSTGAPRPLEFTAVELLADARQVTRSMGIRADNLNYALIPLGHSYGLGNLTLPLLAHGVPLVCGTAPLPQAIAADVARWRPTVFPTVPAVLRALAAADLAPAALRSLRTVISAGAPLPPEVARAFVERFGRRVHAFYGSSETGGIAYDRSGQATLAGGVGRPLTGVTVRVRRDGRLEVSSAAVVTRGNRRRRDALGAWLTPDLARIDGRGEITLLGRRGTTVKIGGRRVNLGEVAVRLRRAAGVRDVWVGIAGGAEAILGAAVLTERSSVELRAELARDTAPWKVPKRWATLAEFPQTRRGKTDTQALRVAVFGADEGAGQRESTASISTSSSLRQRSASR